MARRPRVIADAGPLMVLAKLNALPLLKRLYGTVLISQTVYDEVVIEGLARGYSDAGVVKFFWEQQGWRPVVVEDTDIPEDLQKARLDPGEKESLFLATRSSRTLLLVDEEAAREAARERGVAVRGTLGLLAEAFRKRLIALEELEFLFAQIEQWEDVWISTELCRQVLAVIKKEHKKKSRKRR